MWWRAPLRWVCRHPMEHPVAKYARAAKKSSQQRDPSAHSEWNDALLLSFLRFGPDWSSPCDWEACRPSPVFSSPISGMWSRNQAGRLATVPENGSRAVPTSERGKLNQGMLEARKRWGGEAPLDYTQLEMLMKLLLQLQSCAGEIAEVMYHQLPIELVEQEKEFRAQVRKQREADCTEGPKETSNTPIALWASAMSDKPDQMTMYSPPDSPIIISMVGCDFIFEIPSALVGNFCDLYRNLTGEQPSSAVYLKILHFRDWSTTFQLHKTGQPSAVGWAVCHATIPHWQNWATLKKQTEFPKPCKECILYCLDSFGKNLNSCWLAKLNGLWSLPMHQATSSRSAWKKVTRRLMSCWWSPPPVQFPDVRCHQSTIVSDMRNLKDQDAMDAMGWKKFWRCSPCGPDISRQKLRTVRNAMLSMQGAYWSWLRWFRSSCPSRLPWLSTQPPGRPGRLSWDSYSVPLTMLQICRICRTPSHNIAYLFMEL